MNILSIVFVILYIFLPFLLFYPLMDSNTIKEHVYLTGFYYINFFIIFLFKLIHNTTINTCILLFFILIWILQAWIFLKKKNNLALNYIIIYISIFNLLTLFFEITNIDINEELILSFGYGQIFNFLLLFLIYSLYTLHAIFFYLKIVTNGEVVNNIIYLLLLFSSAISGFYLEIPKAIVKLLILLITGKLL